MDKIERGYQAKALLENALFVEVMNQLDQLYTAAWRNAKTVDAREDCYRYVKLTEKLIGDIQSVANTGLIDKARQDEIEANKKRGMIPW